VSNKGSEKQHQEALVEWVRIQWWRDSFAHWPNERASKSERHHMWKAGVTAGPLDNWLFLPRGGYCGAVSELKRPGAPPSAVTESQAEWIARLEECGFHVGVHFGWEAAAEFFTSYLRGGATRQDHDPVVTEVLNDLRRSGSI